MTSVRDELTDEEQAEYREAFNLFDKDGNGRITVSEIREVMVSMGGNKPTDDEIRDLIADIDTDNNGTLEFEEFLVFMQRSKNSSKEPAYTSCMLA